MYFCDNFKIYNYQKNANNSTLNNFIQNVIGRLKPTHNFLLPKSLPTTKKWGLSYKMAQASPTQT